MVKFDNSKFYKYQEIRDFLDEVEKAYPDLISVSVIGKSHEGREIVVATLTNKKTGLDTEKPGYWIDANIHAGEVTGATVALYTIWRYTSEYGKDERITRLMNDYTVYVCPRISVDGSELYLTSPHILRSSTKRYPHTDDRDGLYPEDVDGDGRILQMRIKDTNGPWRVSEKDKRVMVKRKPDEFGGEYYSLISEGIINNFDGHEVKLAGPRHGLDLNRNFPYDWAPEGVQSGAGDFPFSEPETRSLAEFWTTHKNINGFVEYHTYSGVFLRPYSTYPDSQFSTHDLEVFKLIGGRATEITGYPCVSVFHNFAYDPKEPMHGVMDDYCFDYFGWFGFTDELWDAPTAAGIDLKQDWINWTKNHPEEDDLKIMEWNDKKLHGKGFETWREFDHPQLGKVEIGGWDYKYAWQNAPAEYLPEICEKHSTFTLAHALMSSRLELVRSDVEAVGDGAYKISVVVSNTGFLPTYTSKRGLERKAVRPMEVSLKLPKGATILSGKADQEAGQLEGRTNKIYSGWYSSRVMTDNQKRFEWIVRSGKGGSAQVTVMSERAGTLRATLDLA
ncbi:MAG: M14 family metallopeptidase [Chloroflexia bacterium]